MCSESGKAIMFSTAKISGGVVVLPVFMMVVNDFLAHLYLHYILLFQASSICSLCFVAFKKFVSVQ